MFLISYDKWQNTHKTKIILRRRINAENRTTNYCCTFLLLPPVGNCTSREEVHNGRPITLPNDPWCCCHNRVCSNEAISVLFCEKGKYDCPHISVYGSMLVSLRMEKVYIEPLGYLEGVQLIATPPP